MKFIKNFLTIIKSKREDLNNEYTKSRKTYELIEFNDFSIEISFDGYTEELRNDAHTFLYINK